MPKSKRESAKTTTRTYYSRNYVYKLLALAALIGWAAGTASAVIACSLLGR